MSVGRLHGLLTAKGHLGEDQQVQAFELGLVRLFQDGVGTAEVARDIADLGGELQTADPHVGELCD